VIYLKQKYKKLKPKINHEATAKYYTYTNDRQSNKQVISTKPRPYTVGR
jgi:hypothetical protein